MSGFQSKRENVVRDWLIMRRRRDGLKMREVAAEFKVSVAFVHQVVTRSSDLVFTWRCQRECPECGSMVSTPAVRS